MRYEKITLVIEKPAERLRFAPKTRVRPGKSKHKSKGNGKWKLSYKD